MTRAQLLGTLRSPLPNAVLKKYYRGHIMQLWGESPELYSAAFGQKDDLHRYVHGHTGLDIATFFRDTVVAAHDGVVQGIQDNPTAIGGRVVWLDSPELEDGKVQTAYAHLDQILVKPGQEVKRGDPIGYEGNTGFVISGGTPYWGNAPAGVGVHLHFALYELAIKNGTWVFANPYTPGHSTDPLPWLTGDWSGTSILLENMKKLLLYWLTKVAKK